MNMIKVSATSRTSAVAGAIAGVVREHHRAEVQAIGAGAVNQAVKALALATGYLRLDGINVSCVPEFADVTIDDKMRTAIKLVIEPGPTPNSSESADATTEDKVRTAIEKVVEPQRSPDDSEAP
jgi:stage V sporulation protein S